jgi:hypothetical protein
LIENENVLLDETYSPDFDNRISIDITDIVINELTFTVPLSNSFIQHNLLKTFIINVNNDIFTFSAVRAGVSDLSVAPADFLRENFLTWQPREKTITRNQPEFLTYYCVTSDTWLFMTAYFTDGTNQMYKIVELQTGKVTTVNISYFIRNIDVTPKQVEFFTTSNDANPLSEKLSKYQYYRVVDNKPDEQYFLFENSLGGLDTVRCTGEQKSLPEFGCETALMGDEERTFFTERKDFHSQTTALLTRYETAWLHDFFMAKRRYLYDNGKLKSIVIDEITADTSNMENLRAFDFRYRLAISSQYLNITENSENTQQPEGGWILTTGNWNDNLPYNDNEHWKDS